MANKIRKPAGSARRPVKGPMSVDKSNTPVWMRAVIIVVALSFVATGIAVVWAGASGSGGKSGEASSDSIAATYQPRVKSAQDVLATNPDSPDSIAEVGRAYYEWADALYRGGQQPASVPVWRQAATYYDQALAIRPDDDAALGNKAFALYYAQDFDLAKPAIETFIAAASDNPALSAKVEEGRKILTELAASANATTTPRP